jgi:hypothetical protein
MIFYHELKKQTSFNIPWQLVANRLSGDKGSSGQAIQQHLDKLQREAWKRGSWIPPRIGTGDMHDPDVRGYVKCFDEDGNERVREIGWDEDTTAMVEAPVHKKRRALNYGKGTKKASKPAKSGERVFATRRNTRQRSISEESDNEETDPSKLPGDAEFNPSKVAEQITRGMKEVIMKATKDRASHMEGIANLNNKYEHKAQLMRFDEDEEEHMDEKVIKLKTSPGKMRQILCNPPSHVKPTEMENSNSNSDSRANGNANVASDVADNISDISDISSRADSVVAGLGSDASDVDSDADADGETISGTAVAFGEDSGEDQGSLNPLSHYKISPHDPLAYPEKVPNTNAVNYYFEPTQHYATGYLGHPDAPPGTMNYDAYPPDINQQNMAAIPGSLGATTKAWSYEASALGSKQQTMAAIPGNVFGAYMAQADDLNGMQGMRYGGGNQLYNSHEHDLTGGGMQMNNDIGVGTHFNGAVEYGYGQDFVDYGHDISNDLPIGSFNQGTVNNAGDNDYYSQSFAESTNGSYYQSFDDAGHSSYHQSFAGKYVDVPLEATSGNDLMFDRGTYAQVIEFPCAPSPSIEC